MEPIFFVDYAASGPYADIDMSRDEIDGIFLSMHKNIGGANLGILVGKNHIYDLNAHPSFGGGGTVTAVTPKEYHFHDKIEEREYPALLLSVRFGKQLYPFSLKNGSDWIPSIKLIRTSPPES